MNQDDRTIAMHRPEGPESRLVGRILDHYHLKELIGKGGMGYVYSAEDQTLQRRVAVKVFPAELLDDTVLLRRFQTEARSCARLNHPNVAAIYRFGEQDGLYFMVMELLDGGDLNTRIHRTEPPTFGEAAEIIRQASAGLAAAHQLGIVHRDVKPSNIMFNRRGVVKVTDFGLARVADASRDITARGAILGTPHYMSPEQCQGREADARSDVYSLGVTFYTLLTGHVPFRGDSSMAIMFQHLHEPPPNLIEVCPELPAPVFEIISRCLEKRPEDRYHHCGEVLEALELFLSDAGSLSERRLVRRDDRRLSRWLDAETFAGRVLDHQSSLRPATPLSRSRIMPRVPQCRVVSCETRPLAIETLQGRPMTQQELAEASVLLDRFAAERGQAGLPADLSKQVEFRECVFEPLVFCELRVVMSVLDFKVDYIPWNETARLPEGVRSYDPDDQSYILSDELLMHHGDLFTDAPHVGEPGYEEFRPFAALPEETCRECQGRRRISCPHCRKGSIISEVREQYEAVEDCPDCGGTGRTPTEAKGGQSNCPTCSGQGELRTPAWRRRQESQTCPHCRGSGDLTCPVCDGQANVRPIIHERRLTHLEGVKETRFNGTLETRYVDRCGRPDDFFRLQLAHPTPGDLVEKLNEHVRPAAEQAQATPAQLDVAPLAEAIEQRRQDLVTRLGSQLVQGWQEYRELFESGPARNAGLLDGPRTVRYLQADLSFGAAFIRRLTFQRGGAEFNAWILPDETVVADALADEWQTETALATLRASVGAILKRAFRIPRSQSDWAVFLLFWGGLSGYLALMVVLVAWALK